MDFITDTQRYTTDILAHRYTQNSMGERYEQMQVGPGRQIYDCSNEHSLLPNCFIGSFLIEALFSLYCFYVLLYVTLLSAPGKHCRAALYKFIL